MASYSVPQVEIHQLFSEIPASLTQTQVPFIFGPNYLLHRYSADDERIGTYIGSYTKPASGTSSFNWPAAIVDRTKVDTGYSKMHGENVMVHLTTVTAKTDGSGASNILAITVASGSPKASTLPGKFITIGTGTYEILNVTSTTESAIKVEIDESIAAVSTAASCKLFELQASVDFTREDPSDTAKSAYQFTQNTSSEENGITINKLVAKPEDEAYGTSYLEVVSAESLYLTTRELSASWSDTIHSVTSASEVSSYLGAVAPENPLAMAVYNAALNANGQTVRFMAVETDDEAGYSAVLDAASLTDKVYFLVPVTRDASIIHLVKEHVNAMSDTDKQEGSYAMKRWRIAFVSSIVPDEDVVYDSTSTTSGTDYTAKVTAVDATAKTATVQFYQGETATTETKFKKYVKVGDTVKYNLDRTEYDVTTPVRYRIVAIVNNNTVKVDNSAGALKSNDTDTAEIWHTYTSTEKAEVIASTSKQLGDRRVYNVFPSVFTGSGMKQTGEFAAACVAGLVSSCLPQQPVTNMDLNGIENIPLVYKTYSMDELNTMAAGGTFIVMQDMPDDKVYVRHQISTDYSSNNLNTGELSITKNLDSISYAFDSMMSPYIGKYNITPELLTTLRGAVNSCITKLSSDSYGLYGPQLIANGTEIVKLEQDEVLKDHVNCTLQLNMPYPFNRMILKLFV